MARPRIAAVALSLLALACQSISLAAPSLPLFPKPISTPFRPGPTFPATDALTQIPLHVGRGVRGAWYEVYFTDPSNPAAGQLTGGLDGPLLAAIDQARLSVHVAMYSFTLHDLRFALIRAHRRGVDVRVVMESDNMDGDDPQALKDAGIPLLGDRREGSMHNKFMVIDGTDVWTGSMNFTVSGVYSDDNNLIHLRSTKIAEDYESEFDEMYTLDRFGPDRGVVTPNRSVVIEGTPVEVYFSPDDHVQAALMDLLEGARSSIDFLAFSFTSDPLGKAIVHAASSGVAVAGVMDADQMQSNAGTEFDTFRSAGLDVRLDGNPGQMHDKVLVIDGTTLVVGSYNFTSSAESHNDENVLVIHSATLAGLYLREFDRIRTLANP